MYIRTQRNIWPPVFCQDEGIGESHRKDALCPQQAETCPLQATTVREKTRVHCVNEKIHLVIVLSWRAVGGVRKASTPLGRQFWSSLKALTGSGLKPKATRASGGWEAWRANT